SPAAGGFQSMPAQAMPGGAYRPAAPALQRPAGGMQRPAAPRPAGKKGSSKTVWILAGVGGGAVVLLLVIFVAVALLLPAVRKARDAARDGARGAQQASASPNSSSASSSTPGTSPPMINQTAADSSQWQTFNSTAGGYSIDMPGRPLPRTQFTPTPAGPITNYIQSLDKGKFVYMCSHADYPPSLVTPQTIDTMLDMAAEGAAQNVKGTINSKTTISVGGFPGREIRFSGNMAGRPFQARSRVVLAGNRMVMALKIGEPGAGSDSEDDRYFNSMSISYQPPSSSESTMPGTPGSSADPSLASTSTDVTPEPYLPSDAATTNAPGMTPPGMTPSNTIPPGPGNFGSSPTAAPVSGDLALKQAIYKRIAGYDRLAQEDPRMKMLDKRFPGAAQNIRKVMEHDRDLFLQNLAAQHRMSIEQIKAIEQEGNAAGWPKE
ncbi:MAG: hypothetical protein KDA59_10840, partial [Planctomycetales bacterium]|nr:hypothetical protein [Planctomycetales bacterium]